MSHKRLSVSRNIYKRGGIYYIDVYIDGKRVRETTGSRTEHGALAYLERRLAAPGTYTTVNDLLDALETEYALAGRLDPRRVTYRLASLRHDFGDMRADDVTNDVVLAYIKRRQRSVSNGTINRDLNVLRRAFSLGRDVGVTSASPRFIRLPDKNVRRGFFTREEVERVCEALPLYLRDFTRFAFITGWRKSEIRNLRRSDVDLQQREIRIWDSKNGEGRVIGINRELENILRRAYESPGVFVFVYRGRRIGDFKKAWRTATRRVQLQGRTFHDLRRSAVRNLVAAGVTRQVAKRITGHRTDSVFDRYHIVTDDDVKDAMLRLDAKS